MPRQLREYKLSDPVREYFEKQGYAVYTEIPIAGSKIDLVARKGNFLIGIELKTSLTRQLIHQCIRHQCNCDIFYAAVPVNPISKNIDICKKYSIGIIRISDETEIIVEANQRFKPLDWKHKRMLNFCDTILPGGLGGLPTQKGRGPRIECAKRVKEYIMEHPTTKWKELFNNVHNHYSDYKSMYNALRGKL